jgi:hypothetical protein
VAIDLSDREVRRLYCPKCARDFDRVVIFATQDGDAYSAVSAECHAHPEPAVWLHATFGSWTEPFEDHVTFTCLVGSEWAGLEDPSPDLRDAAHLGQCLTRAQGLEEPRLAILWPLVDQVVTTVPEIARHIYGPEGFQPAE